MLIGLLIFWCILGALVGMIAQSKGRSFLGFFIYGFLLFPVALIHALIMRSDYRDVEQVALASGLRKCPHCAEMIKPEANVCRFCGRDVAPRPPADIGAGQI